MSPLDRAKAAHAAAEATDSPADRAAWRAAAALWERIAGPGVPWSHELAKAELRQLRIDVAVAMGPFRPQQPPKAPPPAADQQDDRSAGAVVERWAPRVAVEASIEF